MKLEKNHDLREMVIADLDAVVAIHIESFPGFFLTFLGPSFLRELYRGILEDVSGLILVFEKFGQVLGFVAGTVEPRGFYTRLLRSRWWRFGFSSIMPIIRRPNTLIRVLRSFGKSSEYQDDIRTALLMSIAVHPDAQRRGLGFQLVEAFVSQAGVLGVEQVELTTDRDNNPSINKFYLARGFFVAETFCTPEGRFMNKYVRKLRENE